MKEYINADLEAYEGGPMRLLFRGKRMDIRMRRDGYYLAEGEGFAFMFHKDEVVKVSKGPGRILVIIEKGTT